MLDKGKEITRNPQGEGGQRKVKYEDWTRGRET